jgi:2-methylcitrate dehydratase PrpD
MAVGLGVNTRGFHITGVVGALTSAVAAARALGLDATGVQDAIGIAGSFACGLGAAQFGSSVKRMHAGRAAQGGTYAALLARERFRGIRDLFEVQHGGFVGTFTGECEWDELGKGLGTEWETRVLGYKPYAACAASHTSIDAALDLRADGLRPEDIAQVVVTASTHSRDHVGWAYEPDTITTAQMNLGYAIACAFVDGRVGADQFQDARLADPALLAIAGKVDVVADPAIDARGRTFSHATTMTVHTHDGRTLAAGYDHGKGSEHRPLTDDELEEKFRDQARRALPAERVEAIVEFVHGLDTAADVRDLVALTVPGPR